MRIHHLLAAIALQIASGLVQAAIPALPDIPSLLPDQVRQLLMVEREPLVVRQEALKTEGGEINRRCTPIDKSSSTYRECLNRQDNFNAGVTALEADVSRLSDKVDAAITNEIQRLKAEDTTLKSKIDVTLRAINQMGFSRRSEDYEAWLKLSEESQKEFQDQINEEATEWFSDALKDAAFAKLKSFDKLKGDRLIAWLQANAKKYKLPAPDRAIQAIEHLARFEPKEQLAEDAKFLVEVIERSAKSLKAEDLATALPVLMDSICDLAPEKPLNTQCKVFRTTAKLTSAALYNNATRRVSAHEIERLNAITEQELQTLKSYNDELKREMTKRNDIRARIKKLEEL